MASPQQNLLTDLPDGALARILGLLPARDLAVVLRVCSRLRAAAAAPPLWRALLRRDFGLPLAAPARRDEAVGAASSGGGGGAGGSGGGTAATAAEFDSLGAYATLAAAIGAPDDDERGKRQRQRRRSPPPPAHLHALRFSAAYCDGGVDRDNHDDYTFDHALCPNRWAPFCSESAVDVSIVGLLSDDRPAAQQHRPPNSNDAVVEEHRARLVERCRLAACQMFMKRIDFSALVPQQGQQQQQGQGQEGGTTAAAEAAAAAAAVMAAAPTGGGGGGGGADGPSHNNGNNTNPNTHLSSNAATGNGPLRSTPAAARCAALAAAEATLAAWPTGTLRRLFFDLWGDLQQGEALHGGAGNVPLDPAYTGPGRWGRLLLLEAEAADAAEGGGGEGGAAAAAAAASDTNAPSSPLIDPFRGAAPTARARDECADLAHQILFNDRLLPVAPEPIVVPRRPPARQQPEQDEQQAPNQWPSLSSPSGAAPPSAADANAPNATPSPHFAPYCLAKARRTHRLVDAATHLRHFGLTPRANTTTATNPPPPPFGRRGVTACVREVVVSRAGELTCPVAAGVIMLGQVAGNTPLIGPTESAPAPEKLYERLTGCDPAVADGFGDLMAQRVVEAADAAAAAAAGAGGEAAARSALPSLLTASDVLRASRAGVLPPVLAHHVVDGGEAEWIEFCPLDEEGGEGGEDGNGNGNGSPSSSSHPHPHPHKNKTSPLPLVLWWRFAARDELPPEIPDGWDPGEGALVSEMAVESVVAPWLASADASAALGGGGGDNGPSSSITNLFFGGGGLGGGTDNAAEMLALAAAGGIAMGGGGAWLDDDDEDDDEDEELATADEDEDDDEEEEEFFDEAEEADAPLTDSDGLPVGIGGAAAAGAGAGAAATAAAAGEEDDDDQGAEPDDEVPWDAHGEADLPSSGGGDGGGTGGGAPGPPPPQQPQPTPQVAAVMAVVSSTMDARGRPREGLRRREVLAHVETHPETVLEWPSLMPHGGPFGGFGGGDGSSGAASDEEEDAGGGQGEGEGGDGDGDEGAGAAPSFSSAPQPPPRPRHHRTDLLPSAFDHAAAAATLRGEVASSSAPSSPQPPQQHQQQRGLAVLPPPPIAPFEAPLVRSSPGERIIASIYSKRDEQQQQRKTGRKGRRRHRRATVAPAPPPLPPAQPTHTQVRMRLTRPRCGNTLVLRLLQPEDRMAEYHDHHPAPNVDVAFVSVRGVAVRLEGGAGGGGGAELRADVET
jgi:hypothetical protein